MGCPIPGSSHPHCGERGGDTAVDLRPWEPLVQRAERDVLRHGRHEQLIVRILEDDADARPQVVQRLVTHREAGDLELSLTAEQPVQVEHERGLAGAIRPEQRDALTVTHEVDPGESGVPVRIAVNDTASVDRAAHRVTPTPIRTASSEAITAAPKARSAAASRSGAAAGIRPW